MSPLKLTGADEIIKRVTKALERMPGLTVEGVRDVTIDIGARAAKRAPVDSGALRGSMKAEVKADGEGVIGEIRFTEDYAAVQHERVDFRHPKGGEAKYLERSAFEKADQILDMVADAYKDLFGGGT